MSGQPLFGTPERDQQLERVSQQFWRSLLGHLRAEVAAEQVDCLLDIGCHTGGLLELAAKLLSPRLLCGIEPLATARDQARFRLSRLSAEIRLLPPSEWSQLPAGGVDLAISHETLQLVEELDELMAQLARVLRPGARAYLVLGCHTENPLWPGWKKQLIAGGHEAFDHAPLEILRAASRAGLHTAVRPLRRDGWIIYDPEEAEYRYPSCDAMLAHHYRHKLLFRLDSPADSP